ncbi:hypothetical protein AVEN_5029-1 [Araneus ventricosus]|uniref:Uncharacterized protein n=1 Tax=Araneus ventricosus TaxID=182803 RepID=A0A4Y2JN79_ARAVE|nr:hypothetical protein AVEN_5029-1 [Araneus ventricosus]
MDSSDPFPLFSSLRVEGDMNDRLFIFYLSLKTRPTAFSLLLGRNRPTSIEVAWAVTGGLGLRVLTSEKATLNDRGTEAKFAALAFHFNMAGDPAEHYVSTAEIVMQDEDDESLKYISILISIA